MNVIKATGPGKRYRRNWALRECTLAIPAGQVTALAAFAGGALAGMLVLRIVPAIAVTLVACSGLAFAAGGFLRQDCLAPLLSSSPSVPGEA